MMHYAKMTFSIDELKDILFHYGTSLTGLDKKSMKKNTTFSVERAIQLFEEEYEDEWFGWYIG